MSDSGETINVPDASEGTGTGVISLIFGSATKRLMILTLNWDLKG